MKDTTTQENRKIKGREIQNTIFGEANITKMIESTPEDKAFINFFECELFWRLLYTHGA